METVKLIIDRKPVEVPKGTTILDAAKGMGIRIPTLCYMKLEDLHYENNPGACRICVVEIEGRRNLAPSCKTECMEGMVVQTHSPRVMNARKTVMELILSNHPAECLTCSSNGHCELQAIAHDLGIREIRYKGEMSTFQIDRSPSIVRNMNKCIMCRRCETMCNNIQTVGALTAVNRGFNAAVSTAFERDIAGSTVFLLRPMRIGLSGKRVERTEYTTAGVGCAGRSGQNRDSPDSSGCPYGFGTRFRI